jgi:NADH-quinone oxidoreductase subunit J
VVEAIVFYIFAGLMLSSSVAILLARDIVRAAVWLLGALGSAAGLFLLLSANFIAAIQLIVYVGGVLVLIVFGVMLTSRIPAERHAVRLREIVIAGIVGTVLLVGLLVAQFAGPWPPLSSEVTRGATVREIGRALLSTWLVPFELVSVLLLAVMIGAAYLARPTRAG